jgi:glutathione-regulated potassium-efflux system ancillary protein KefF
LSTDICLIAAHPDWNESRINRLLFEAARKMSRVDVLDLFGTYPDYVIDVAAEQDRLSAARLIVLMHPVHWYSMPALLKLWIDDVLSYGWAYGHGGTALRGKDLWLALTTGGPEASYRANGYSSFAFESFLPPYVQTANLCGMRFLPPQIVYGAHRIDATQVATVVEQFVQRLETYPHWPDIDACVPAPESDVPEVDRLSKAGAAALTARNG